MRIGFGYDVHRLIEGRPLILGGVHVPYEKGLLGHSDADVLIHAICDALLGAVALGDIGKHFPDTDERWKDADSRKLLREVANLVAREGFRISNVDATIAIEKPKLSPYIDQMRQNIASTLGIYIDEVSVKATTSEQLGFVGTGQGAAAHAVALVVRAG